MASAWMCTAPGCVRPRPSTNTASRPWLIQRMAPTTPWSSRWGIASSSPWAPRAFAPSANPSPWFTTSSTSCRATPWTDGFDRGTTSMKVLVTGTAGFIGSHLALRLLARGDEGVGFDSLSDYYDVELKKARLARFADKPGYTHIHADLADRDAVENAFATHKPQ